MLKALNLSDLKPQAHHSINLQGSDAIACLKHQLEWRRRIQCRDQRITGTQRIWSYAYLQPRDKRITGTQGIWSYAYSHKVKYHKHIQGVHKGYKTQGHIQRVCKTQGHVEAYSRHRGSYTLHRRHIQGITSGHRVPESQRAYKVLYKAYIRDTRHIQGIYQQPQGAKEPESIQGLYKACTRDMVTYKAYTTYIRGIYLAYARIITYDSKIIVPEFLRSYKPHTTTSGKQDCF